MVGSYVSTKWFKQSWGIRQPGIMRYSSIGLTYLDCQSCLAHATVSQDHQLVQCHLARHLEEFPDQSGATPFGRVGFQGCQAGEAA